MIDKVAADVQSGIESAKSVPTWLLLLVFAGSPAVSGVLSGNLSTNAVNQSIERMREDLEGETAARLAFEARCAAERRELDTHMAEFRLEQQRQQLMLAQVERRQAELLESVKRYQGDMSGLVKDIAAGVREMRGPAQ